MDRERCEADNRVAVHEKISGPRGGRAEFIPDFPAGAERKACFGAKGWESTILKARCAAAGRLATTAL
jgi:hypothetical protein